MAIKMIKGLPSAGKSYLMTKIAKKAIEDGRQVYSNYKLGYADQPQPQNLHYWREPRDLLAIDKGLIVMDEAHVYFNSRMWTEFPIEVQYKFQQHAKDGLDIIGTVQHEARIDVVIRELVQEWIWITRLFGSARDTDFVFGAFIANHYYPEDLTKANSKPWSREWHWYVKSVARYYDTLAKIDRPEDADISYIKMKVCSSCGHQRKIGTVSIPALMQEIESREAARSAASGLDN